MNIIYFVQRADGDIKIGTCLLRRFPLRLVELEKKHGQLVFHGYIEGGIEKERELHDRFTDYQRVVITRRYSIPCKTEFFEPSVAILGFIERNCIQPSPSMCCRRASP